MPPSTGENAGSPHPWWAELRHGGTLLSLVVLAEWLPDGPPTLDERRYRRLRDRFTAFQAKTAGGHDGPALHDWHDALLEDFLGHTKERWRKAADVPEKVTATSVTRKRHQPHRAMLDECGGCTEQRTLLYQAPANHKTPCVTTNDLVSCRP